MIIKLASITIPDSHLKEDHSQLEYIKKNTKDIYHVLAQPVRGFHQIGETMGVNKMIQNVVKTVKEMEAEDKETMKKYKTKR